MQIIMPIELREVPFSFVEQELRKKKQAKQNAENKIRLEAPQHVSDPACTAWRIMSFYPALHHPFSGHATQNSGKK